MVLCEDGEKQELQEVLWRQLKLRGAGEGLNAAD